MVSRSRSVLVMGFGGRVVERPLRDLDAVLVIGGGVLIESSVPPVLSLHNIPLSFIANR